MSERSNEDHVPKSGVQSRKFTYELTLSALLEDDVTRLLMDRDGVTPSDIWALARIVPLIRRDSAAPSSL